METPMIAVSVDLLRAWRRFLVQVVMMELSEYNQAFDDTLRILTDMNEALREYDEAGDPETYAYYADFLQRNLPERMRGEDR